MCGLGGFCCGIKEVKTKSKGYANTGWLAFVNPCCASHLTMCLCLRHFTPVIRDVPMKVENKNTEIGSRRGRGEEAAAAQHHRGMTTSSGAIEIKTRIAFVPINKLEKIQGRQK